MQLLFSFKVREIFVEILILSVIIPAIVFVKGKTFVMAPLIVVLGTTILYFIMSVDARLMFKYPLITALFLLTMALIIFFPQQVSSVLGLDPLFLFITLSFLAVVAVPVYVMILDG